MSTRRAIGALLALLLFAAGCGEPCNDKYVCDGTIARSCTHGEHGIYRSSFDCSEYDRFCVDVDGQGVCVESSERDPDCLAGNDRIVCHGGTKITCFDGYRTATEECPVGAMCAQERGLTRCIVGDPEPRCSPGVREFCDENTWVDCFAGHRSSQGDCGAGFCRQATEPSPKRAVCALEPDRDPACPLDELAGICREPADGPSVTCRWGYAVYRASCVECGTNSFDGLDCPGGETNVSGNPYGSPV